MQTQNNEMRDEIRKFKKFQFALIDVVMTRLILPTGSVAPFLPGSHCNDDVPSLGN